MLCLFGYSRVNAVNELGEAREEACGDKIKEIGQAMGIERSICWKKNDWEPLKEVGAESLYEGKFSPRVYFTYFFLIEPEDLPEQLKISGPEDERLLANPFLEEVITWIENFLGSPISLPKGPEERGAVQTFLLLCQDPAKYRKAREFVFAHEVGHLFYKHTFTKPEKLHKNTVNSALISVISVSFIAKLLNRCEFSKAATYGGLIGGALATYYLAKQLLDCRMYRNHEKEADLKAVETLDEIEGGIYYFECLRTQQLLIRNNPHNWVDSLYLSLATDAKGNNWSFTHPSNSARESYLSNALQKVAS